MNRNVDDHYSKSPMPHYPRSRFDMGTFKRLQTQGHGRLYPFFARIVYPGDTWQVDLSTFVRADTSYRVPLDDIFCDTYFFFVPFRTIDKNFVKVLGEGEPSDYDDVSYGFPTFGISDDDDYDINCLYPYLGYSQNSATVDANLKWNYGNNDVINPYVLAAYYKIYNDWFRDQNVDGSIPYEDLFNSSKVVCDNNPLFDNFNCLKINQYHNYWSSGVISPQKGPAQTVLNSNSAPVGLITSAAGTISKSTTGATSVGAGSYLSGDFAQLFTDTATGVSSNNSGYIADLSAANATINDLRLAFAIQALYEKRGTYGTRYIEVLRGQWGLDVPDLFLQRPEYLGGSRVTLNNIPVLSTENSSQLGQMAGNSATLANGGSFSKSFVDFGVIIGVSCTRIKHSYTQGVRTELFDLFDQLDLYNPVFANIGLQGIPLRTIYNIGLVNGEPDKTVFAYTEPYGYLRTDHDSFAGLFGVFSNNTELKNKWHYGDYYSQAPTFSSGWLKEDYKNIARTLTGQLINGAASTEVEGHQFMFGYYYHPVVTRILPDHAVPATLLGHL